MVQFSKDFLLGTATAAHQVEGNNVHNDIWAMEHMKYTSYEEPSLDAVDHYHLYERDIAMMAGQVTMHTDSLLNGQGLSRKRGYSMTVR